MNKLLIPIFAILIIGVSTAHAQSLPLPQLPLEDVTGVNIYAKYQSDNRYTIHIEVQYQVNSELKVPDYIYTLSTDGTKIIEIPIKEGFIKANTPYVVPSLDDIDLEKEKRIIIREKMEVKRITLQEEKDSYYKSLRKCLEEFKEVQPIRFAAFERTSTLLEFTIPDKEPTNSNLSAFELDGKLKTQACETLKEYRWIGVYYEGMILDEVRNLSLDESDSPLTIPVTPEDIQAEALRAENLDTYWLDPNGDFEGINRGNPYAGESKDNLCQKVPWEFYDDAEVCPLKDRIALDKEPIVDQIALAKDIQCRLYMPHPEAANYHPDKIANFLSHCPLDGFD